jgi:release factor glutamine methyltransferase
VSASDARTRAAGVGERGRGEEPWTVLRLILWSADYLKAKGVDSGRLDAEHLLAHVVGVDRLQLYLQFDRPLAREELDAFRPLLRRRAAREPLQYILGRQPFRELNLEVRPGVLIPRPETEVLVGEVLSWVERSGRGAPTALEVGVGSGAICLSLAYEGYFTHIVATDISDVALAVAGRNRDAAGVAEVVELRKGSLFEPLKEEERFDVIVSNPPYVAAVDEASLEPEVRDWEPSEALFGGTDGLEVVGRIVDGARPRLRDGGLLALEVGADQTGEVAERMRGTGSFEQVSVVRDYSGRKRFVLAHGD